MEFRDFLDTLKSDIGPTLENSIHDHTSKQIIDYLHKKYNLNNKYVLDVGCGLGRDCKYMQSLGAKPTGITINQEEFLKKSFRNTKYMDMHSLHLYYYRKYDLIYASHVLEHSPAPLYVLKQFKDLLVDDGIIYIEVPSPKPWSIHNQNHYSIFCKEMWLELFSKANFNCEEQINLKVNIADKEGENPYIEDEFWGFILKKNVN